jgi:hypothetical protein
MAQGERRPDRRREDHLMPGKAKTILMWVVIVFLLYAVVQSPDRAADIVQAIWDVILGAFQSFGQFVQSLMK